jgi:DnaJ-class molecular chaperone
MGTVVTLLLVAAILAVWQAITVYVWPYAPCRRCEGSGRNAGSDRNRFGQCRRCKGAGRRIRFGAKTVHRGRVALADRKKGK